MYKRQLCFLGTSCLLNGRKEQVERPVDRVLPGFDDSDEGESSSELCGNNSWKDSSLSHLSDDAEDTTRTHEKTGDNLSFYEYATAASRNDNVFGPPPEGRPSSLYYSD